MRKPELIDTAEGLNKFINAISGESHIAVDSESNSFYAYKPRICLIQISSEHNDFILDSIALNDISVLGRILADPQVEKVLHAAENDLIGLRRDFGLDVRNIFDTALACRLLGWKRLGLAKILSEEFGVKVDKKFQRCNWAQRPLSSEQLYYAQMDTHFLIQLRQRLYRQLLERNLTARAQEHFERLELVRSKPAKIWKPDDCAHLKGAQELPVASLRTLKALFSYREHLARRTNRAPFRIINNELLVRLARELPEDRHALLKVRGLPSHFKDRRAKELLRVIQKSKSTA